MKHLLFVLATGMALATTSVVDLTPQETQQIKQLSEAKVQADKKAYAAGEALDSAAKAIAKKYGKSWPGGAKGWCYTNTPITGNAAANSSYSCGPSGSEFDADFKHLISY